MLSQLTIRNFAIIDHLQIDWHPGLNVITGETGAGKSILIDAVGALLGDRLGPEVVRSGAPRAVLEGVFLVPAGSAAAELIAVLDEFGLQPEDGALIVSREIAGPGGRGGARVNGRSVPLSVLQQLGELLVDVHGQSEHMALLRTREQLDYLDRYAGVLAIRADVARLVRELRGAREARRKLIAEERESARLAEMLRHEVAEIDAAEVREDEEAELIAQRTRLQHVERLRQAASMAYAALMGDEGETGDRPGAIDLLGAAVAACQDGGKIDPVLLTEGETLSVARIQAEESARALQAYLESVEADPRALELTVERLFVLGDLRRKYGESLKDVLDYAADARTKLVEIDQRADRLDALHGRELQLEAELGGLAGKLSRHRQTAAHKLSEAVERELTDLRLAGARFVVSIAQTPSQDTDGVPLGDTSVAVDMTGIDRVEFLLATIRGDEPRPMARVASGGELARISLALKTVLSHAETRATLIFDEIDVGVGGRTAPVVGQKLAAVAAAGHQVLCVTHMPQVAAFADFHYVVSRSSVETGSQTGVALLQDEQRVEELASMLAGTPTEATRQSARELLGRAVAARELSQSRPLPVEAKKSRV